MRLLRPGWEWIAWVEIADRDDSLSDARRCRGAPARDQLMTLAAGYWDLGNALKARMAERIGPEDRAVTLQGTTEEI